jgi:hypothetical protein
MPKVVINSCFGGFGLSHKAVERLAQIKCVPDDGEVIHHFQHSSDNHIRSDQDLVKIVEELGDEASGCCAKLSIVDVPDDAQWYVHEYDGLETVREGRVWGL